MADSLGVRSSARLASKRRRIIQDSETHQGPSPPGESSGRKRRWSASRTSGSSGSDTDSGSDSNSDNIHQEKRRKRNEEETRGGDAEAEPTISSGDKGGTSGTSSSGSSSSSTGTNDTSGNCINASHTAIPSPRAAAKQEVVPASTQSHQADLSGTPSGNIVLENEEHQVVTTPDAVVAANTVAVAAAGATAAAEASSEEEADMMLPPVGAHVSLSETQVHEWLSPCCVCLDHVVVDPVCMPCCSNAMCQHCLATWLSQSGGLVRCPLCNVETLFPCIPAVDRVRRDLFRQRYPVRYPQREERLREATQGALSARQQIYTRNARYMHMIRHAGEVEVQVPVARTAGSNSNGIASGVGDALVMGDSTILSGQARARLRALLQHDQQGQLVAFKRHRRNFFTVFIIAFFILGLFLSHDALHEQEEEGRHGDFLPQRAPWSRREIAKWNETDVEQWLDTHHHHHSEPALGNVSHWDLRVNGLGTGAQLKDLSVADLDFVENDSAKVALLSAVQAVQDKEEAVALALSPIYLWHGNSRRKVASAIFSAGFAVAPRTTLLACYLLGEPFPFQLLDNYDLGVWGQILLWMLPQMHVLHLVLRFTAQFPVVVIVQVASLLASVEGDLVLMAHILFFYCMQGVGLVIAVGAACLHVNWRVGEFMTRSSLYFVLSDGLAGWLTLSLQATAHVDVLVVPVVMAMIMQGGGLTTNSLWSSALFLGSVYF